MNMTIADYNSIYVTLQSVFNGAIFSTVPSKSIETDSERRFLNVGFELNVFYSPTIALG